MSKIVDLENKVVALTELLETLRAENAEYERILQDLKVEEELAQAEEGVHPAFGPEVVLSDLIEANGLGAILKALGPLVPETDAALRYALGYAPQRCKICGKLETACQGHAQCEICHGVDGKHGTIRVQYGVREYPNGSKMKDKDGNDIPVMKSEPCPNDPGPCPACGAKSGYPHRQHQEGVDENGKANMIDCPNKGE